MHSAAWTPFLVVARHVVEEAAQSSAELALRDLFLVALPWSLDMVGYPDA